MPKKIVPKSKRAKDPRRVAVGKMARRKGASNERAVGKTLESWWGYTFRRTPLSGGWAGSKRAREGFGAAGDLVCEDPTFPFCLEIKSEEGWELEQLIRSPEKCKIAAWWKQTTEETPAGKLPLLLFTRKLRPWYAMLNSEPVISALLEGRILVPPMMLLMPTNPVPALILLEHLTRLTPQEVRAAVAKGIVRRGMPSPSTTTPPPPPTFPQTTPPTSPQAFLRLIKGEKKQ